MNRNTKVYDLVVTAVLTALVFVFTSFLNIRLPISVNGGLIHLGNIMMVIACMLFGPKKGALSAALGMGLFDLVSGWTIWAPFTAIIRGAMGYVMGVFMQRRTGSRLANGFVGVLLGGAVQVAGYYLAECILYGNPIVALSSIPGELVLVASGLAGLPVALQLLHYPFFSQNAK